MKNELEKYIRNVADFPKAGVNYKDITPLLASKEAIDLTLKAFIDDLEGQQIDKVVGIESRGFFFAALLARELEAGIVPIRKPGKLPYATHMEVYEKEYGKDTLEIHEDAISKGDKVLLHDDVLATGGTAEAACKLIRKCGGEIVKCQFLVELDFMNGGKRIKSYPRTSLLHY